MLMAIVGGPLPLLTLNATGVYAMPVTNPLLPVMLVNAKFAPISMGLPLSAIVMAELPLPNSGKSA